MNSSKYKDGDIIVNVRTNEVSMIYCIVSDKTWGFTYYAKEIAKGNKGILTSFTFHQNMSYCRNCVIVSPLWCVMNDRKDLLEYLEENET
jgi:hypothetical protein